MTITAKYQGRCGNCNGAIEVGTSIEWVRGAKPTHKTCPEAAAPVAPAPAAFPAATRSAGANRFAGRCSDCGSHVPAGAGFLLGRKVVCDECWI